MDMLQLDILQELILSLHHSLGHQGSDSGDQAWQQALLPSVPSHQPTKNI